MNIDKLPQDTRRKIKHQEKIIGTLNSTELLEYSKTLNRSREVGNDYADEIVDHLFDVIQNRTLVINSSVDKKETARLKMEVNNFERAL